MYLIMYGEKGTFGQTIPWNLYDPATYQHPSVPLDILTDPKSLPVAHQKKEEEETNPADKSPTSVREYTVDFPIIIAIEIY